MRPTVASGPVVSYTAVSPLPAHVPAVCSLLRYLSGRPGRTLSAIVLCGARKFLNRVSAVAAIERSQPLHCSIGADGWSIYWRR